jgi:hypothetical protein
MIPETFIQETKKIKEGSIHTLTHPGGFYFSWVERESDTDSTVYEEAVSNSRLFVELPELCRSDIPEWVWISFKEQTKDIPYSEDEYFRLARQVLDALLY